MTGEMSKFDISKDGEHYEWAQAIKFAALRLMRMTHKRIKLWKVCPYDEYQGPYAQMTSGSLWGTEHSKIFYYDGAVEVQGTLREIADAINAAKII